jgi:hypothetical protein
MARGIRAVAALAMAAATLLAQPSVAVASLCANDHTGLVALPDLGPGEYLGAQGGLYAGGTNVPPTVYLDAGAQLAADIGPLDAAGQPDPAGRFVLLGMGGSPARYELDAFLARMSGRVNGRLTLVNAGIGGHDLTYWQDPLDTAWTQTDSLLDDAGVTPAQVTALWMQNTLKTNDDRPFATWVADNDAAMRATLAIAAARFPNLQQVFLSSATYGDYMEARTRAVEPWGYQHGFAVRDIVTDSVADPAAGPWITWGPYLWTDGIAGRADGFVWNCDDVEDQGEHPSPTGAAKIAALLDDFFSTSPASTWFRRNVPRIDGIAPAVLAKGSVAQQVVLTGDNLLPGAALSLGDGVMIESAVADGTTLTATVDVAPDAPATVRDARVTNVDGSTSTLAAGFEVTGVKVVAASPSPVVAGSRLAVTVTGAAFADGATVTIGRGVKVKSVRRVDATKLKIAIAVQASAPPGTRLVTVTNPDGTSASCTCFAVTSP